MIPHPDPERNERPIEYLENRGYDIEEEMGRYEGYESCTECGWPAHEFWVGHSEMVMRQIIYCPACRLTSKFDEEYDWNFYNLTDRDE